jgi:hypothetical protein
MLKLVIGDLVYFRLKPLIHLSYPPHKWDAIEFYKSPVYSLPLALANGKISLK